MDAILTAVPQLNTICLDVANGYSEVFVECVRDVRRKYPNHTLMVKRLYQVWIKKDQN